jgi:Aminotransferase class-V
MMVTTTTRTKEDDWYYYLSTFVLYGTSSMISFWIGTRFAQLWTTSRSRNIICQRENEDDHDLSLLAHTPDDVIKTTTTTTTTASSSTSLVGEMNRQKQNSIVLPSSSSSCIYLDYNGTTPIYTEIYQVMQPYLVTEFGNPSSSHAYGLQPKLAIQHARKQIIQMLMNDENDDTKDDDDLLCLFTGCGTESNHFAIHLALQKYDSNYDTKQNTNHTSTTTSPTTTAAVQVPHIVTSNIEHPAIIECLESYHQKGLIEVTYVPVQTDGRVKAMDMMDAIRPNQT